MLLHPFFEVLLGASNVRFSSCFALYSIYHQGFATKVGIVTACGVLGSAVAGSGAEVLGDDMFVEFTS